jgi:hypothetical protein
MKDIYRWLMIAGISLVIGASVGYALGFGWFLFSLFVLGYGDSAPAWINSISDILFYFSIIISIIFGQIYFFKRLIKNS